MSDDTTITTVASVDVVDDGRYPDENAAKLDWDGPYFNPEELREIADAVEEYFIGPNTGNEIADALLEEHPDAEYGKDFDVSDDLEAAWVPYDMLPTLLGILDERGESVSNVWESACEGDIFVSWP